MSSGSDAEDKPLVNSWTLTAFQSRPLADLRAVAFGLFNCKELQVEGAYRTFAEMCHILFSRGLATDLEACHVIVSALEDEGFIIREDNNSVTPKVHGKQKSHVKLESARVRGMTEVYTFPDEVINYDGNFEETMAKLRRECKQCTSEGECESENSLLSGELDDSRGSFLEFESPMLLSTCGRYVRLQKSRTVCQYWETMVLFIFGIITWIASFWGVGLGIFFMWWRNYGRRRAYLVLSGDIDEENPKDYGAEAFTLLPLEGDAIKGSKPQYGQKVRLRSARLGVGVHSSQNLLQMGGDAVIRITAEGKDGNIRIGDHVFLISENGQGWGWKTRKGHLDRTFYLADDAMSKVVFTIKKADPTAVNVEAATEMQVEVNSEMHPPRSQRIVRSMSLSSFHSYPINLQVSLVVYNVWMMPALLTAFTQRFLKLSLRKKTRARIIPEMLPPTDIIILSEAFCHRSTPLLAQGLKARGYKFETPPLQGHSAKSERKPLNGGIIVFSRYPIEYIKMVAFGDVACGDDAMADKGVMYVRIRKNTVPLHIFATHTQAWDTEPAKEVRARQFGIIQSFLLERDIPRNEPVFIAGDLNVNKYADVGEEEYQNMLESLKAVDASKDNDPKTYSFDAVNNELATSGPSSDGNCAHLDYILYSREHLRPKSASVETYPIKSTVPYTFQNKRYTDLSDHYPVIGHFTFEVNRTTQNSLGSKMKQLEVELDTINANDDMQYSTTTQY